MWNLNGDDIKSAKEKLETRRATLKAEYEEALKGIETELADIETVERVAVNFVSGRKGDNASPSTIAEPEKAGEKEAASPEAKSATTSEKPAEDSTQTEDKPMGGHGEQKGSRWRMRLGTLSETEAAD